MFEFNKTERQMKIERIVLGSVIKNKQFDLIKDLDSEAFSCSQNEFIFQIMQGLHFDGRPIHKDSVIDELKMRGIVEGVNYVERLMKYDVNDEELDKMIKDMRGSYGRKNKKFDR